MTKSQVMLQTEGCKRGLCSIFSDNVSVVSVAPHLVDF